MKTQQLSKMWLKTFCRRDTVLYTIYYTMQITLGNYKIDMPKDIKIQQSCFCKFLGQVL